MGLFSGAHATSATGGTAAGSANAAELDAELRTVVDVFYDVAASTDGLKIEGSTDGSTWRELDETVASGSITTGGDVVSVRTGYKHVRAYAASGFADSDVNTIEITAKGL